jgi:hypothetical protein
MPDTLTSGSIQAKRVCVVCGGSLANHRSDAHCCSASCRAERSRVSAILSGTYSGPYRSLRERLEAREKRTRGRSRGDLDSLGWRRYPDSRMTTCNP